MKYTSTSTLLLLIGSASATAISSYSTDFEDFDLGANNSTPPGVNGLPAVGGPDGWRGDGLTGLGGAGDYDAEIVDIGGTRGQVFRISNPSSALTGNYDSTHPATPALTKIGENGSGGTPGIFSFSFDFRSVASTYQAGLRVDVTPYESGTASRQSLFRIQDLASGGFSIGVFDTDASGNFVFTDIATNLSRTDWHTLEVSMQMNDGIDNDVVTISLNSGPAIVVGSWEGFYRNAGAGQPETAPVDALIFRLTGAADGLAGGPDGTGVYFDNLVTSAVPEPSTYAALLGALALGLGLARRRLRASRS